MLATRAQALELSIVFSQSLARRRHRPPCPVDLGGNSRHAVLGAARLGPDYDEKGRRLADAGREANRSAH